MKTEIKKQARQLVIEAIEGKKEKKEIMEILLKAGYKKSSASWYINKYKANESN